MSDREQDRVLALAGIFQAAELVRQLAREGQADAAALRASLHSTLAIEADSPAQVYGSKQGVHLGLNQLHAKFTGADKQDLDMARYVLGMIQLEKKLHGQPQMLEAIRQGIETIQSQMAFFSTDEAQEGAHPALSAKLAELYKHTVSTLTPRIIVNGEHGHLSNPATANKVRAALLAGIRSAFLWRQLGGSRWQLLFGRKRLARTAKEVLRGSE